MQWRMVGRRGRDASWTIVGDPAQSSWPDPDEAAAARAEALRARTRRVPPLDQLPQLRRDLRPRRGRRPRVGPDADLPDAVRRTGVEPRLHEVEPPYAGRNGPRQRRATAADVSTARSASSSRSDGASESTTGSASATGMRIPVLEALDTKGLEFDGIVVVEPDEIEAESPAGIRTLYVVLTRRPSSCDVVGTSERWRP